MLLWTLVWSAIGIALVEGLYLVNAFREIEELEERIEVLEETGKPRCEVDDLLEDK